MSIDPRGTFAPQSSVFEWHRLPRAFRYRLSNLYNFPSIILILCLNTSRNFVTVFYQFCCVLSILFLPLINNYRIPSMVTRVLLLCAGLALASASFFSPCGAPCSGGNILTISRVPTVVLTSGSHLAPSYDCESVNVHTPLPLPSLELSSIASPIRSAVKCRYMRVMFHESYVIRENSTELMVLAFHTQWTNLSRVTRKNRIKCGGAWHIFWPPAFWVDFGSP